MKTYGWTMAFLAVAAAQFSFAYWELIVVRSGVCPKLSLRCP